jgi:hypothetical protein
MIAHGNLQCKKTDFEHPPQTSHSPTHRTIRLQIQQEVHGR